MSTLGTAWWIDFLRISMSLSFLSAASWQDYKSRLVSNRMWILFAPRGFTLTLLKCYLEYAAGKTLIILLSVISFAVTTGISLTLFYAGFFGGADAKALICLSIATPVYPDFSPVRFSVIIPFFPIAVLVNAVLVSSMLVLAILGHNLIRYAQLKGALFEGLEHEPLWRKIIVFMTGIKVDRERLKRASHYIPLEYMTEGESGEPIRHLKVSMRLEIDDSGKLEELKGEIWATPGLPFLIFMTIGFLIAFLFGDFTTWLMSMMLR